MKWIFSMILGGSLCIARGGEAGCPLRDLTGGLTPLSGQVAGSALSLGMAQTFALKVNGCALTKAVKDQSPYQEAGFSVVRNPYSSHVNQVECSRWRTPHSRPVGRMTCDGKLHSWPWMKGLRRQTLGNGEEKDDMYWRCQCTDYYYQLIPLLPVCIIITCPVLERRKSRHKEIK